MSRKKAAKKAPVEENLTAEGEVIPEGGVFIKATVTVFRKDKGEITIPESELERYQKSGWKLS